MRKLEARKVEADELPQELSGELPSAHDLVAEIERFLRQQPPRPDPE